MAEDPIDVRAVSEMEEDEEEDQNDAWNDWNSDEDDGQSELLCLFCDSQHECAETLFNHCKSAHSFDFNAIRRNLKLDFYSSFKLINYIRSQVAKNKLWRFENSEEHAWEDDMYLKPFMDEDALLHSFSADEDEDDVDDTMSVDKDELLRELVENGALTDISIDDQTVSENNCSELEANVGNNSDCNVDRIMTNGISMEDLNSPHRNQKAKQLKVSFADVAAREIKKVDEDYFGAYGSFGIHRVMLSDKVRMDAYRGALLNNPSLMSQATVMDVGCGTGILSLFAAQAGASKVVAIEASTKMASIATQIVKDNGLLKQGSQHGEMQFSPGIISVVQCMVEDLNNFIRVEPQSIDVLVSEWMGYCLLYESMLSSVLYARDCWLKPGGAILPDTATIFAAGFGRGGTSLPFWENVYGFNMSCIGKEVVEYSAETPIVDILDSQNILTESVPVQGFDLTTMKADDMDFTKSFELKLRQDHPLGDGRDRKSKTSWCHGLVLWFETAFTSRFCKENPIILSTSPFTPATHWSQTILTFKEPVAMASAESASKLAASAEVGSEQCPATRITCRISLVRSSEHRNIEISIEIMGIGLDGRKRNYPVQVFKL